MADNLSATGHAPLATFVEVNPRRSLSGTLESSTHVSFIPMSDVSETGEWSPRQVRQLKDVSSGFTAFIDGDVLFAKITPCMENGKGCHAIGLSNGSGFGSTEFHVLRASREMDSRFLFHVSQSAQMRLKAEAFMIGSAGQRRVPSEFFSRYCVVVLPLPEQRRIAEILDTLDEAIRKTVQVIAKLQQIKQGLLHDLLTRGIDENGELRDPERHPEQFKDSPLGSIPRGWQVKTLGEVASIIDPNPSHRYPNEVAVGVPIASTENFVGEDDFDLSSATLVPWSAFRQQYSRCSYTDQDVIFARKGRIGFARRYGIDKKVFSHTIVIMKPRGGTDSSFLLWLVRSRLFFSGIRKRMNSNSGVPTLGVDFLGRVPIPQPSLAEQKRIAMALDDSQSQLIAESLELKKLRLLKNGLMDDLLTGRVRVTVEREVAAT